MIEELHALAGGRRMGTVQWDRRRDHYSFCYEDAWRTGGGDAFPLSLSMPFAATDHRHEVVEAFLWGLLPDNEGVLKRWGERFHVSPRNPFRLLMNVGEECAGAVQLVQADKVDAWLAAPLSGKVKWLTAAEIGERMQLLLKDHSATRINNDQGHFSLAGAQPKTALHYDPKGGRWGVPSGSIPTTHIFKPSTGDFDGYAENEHFCMTLARTLGLSAASSVIQHFGDVPVIVVERYDRVRSGARVQRIHQEDMCQALGRLPHMKYQNQGGPSAVEIMEMIRLHSRARDVDAQRFLDALILNWLIAGTDAHAKNYSFLIAPGGQVRLAPLYDVASSLPYPQQVYPRHATLAMRVGNQYKVRQIGPREWKKAASELRCDEAALRSRILEMAQIIPDAAVQIQREMKASGITHDVLKRITTAVQERCAECAAKFSV
ncbi:MAG: type II toxin-antitoxin system HipA family toxin [Verrucomicrobiaceae bacterium]|nr:type II toxin-antitoxin system HipA family toxin [Verrucomicrobiaceae bacterium]